jgi:hypothetical protein
LKALAAAFEADGVGIGREWMSPLRRKLSLWLVGIDDQRAFDGAAGKADEGEVGRAEIGRLRCRRG